jgi:hypothetical protein
MEIQHSLSLFLYTTLPYTAVNAIKITCRVVFEQINTDTQDTLTLTHLFRELTHAEKMHDIQRFCKHGKNIRRYGVLLLFQVKKYISYRETFSEGTSSLEA